jgi:transposase
MEMFGKIRRMYRRDRLSLHEIARRTGLSRNTIKKWLKAAEATQSPKYARRDTPGKLTAFAAQLRQALETDAHRPKRDRRTARALFAQLKDEGYAGGYTRVTDFVRH